MKIAALIGDPVEHSVGPTLHEFLANMLGLEFRYLKVRVIKGQLGAAAAAMRTLGFVGYSVTIPHKRSIIAHLDSVDVNALHIGAVNTVAMDDHGAAVGKNTDWIGVANGLIHHGHPSIVRADRSAVVLGSGGAARAAIYALASLGYRSIIVLVRNQESESARAISADDFGRSIRQITMRSYDAVAEVIANADTVCNMTSAGLRGSNPAPFDLAETAGLNLTGKWFFDAVFNPLKTPFLCFGQANGATCIDGLWMMIYQGIPAFEAWTGHEIRLAANELDELHRQLTYAVQHLERRNPLPSTRGLEADA